MALFYMDTCMITCVVKSCVLFLKHSLTRLLISAEIKLLNSFISVAS